MLLIVDLDDTLFDCTGQMKRETQWEDVKSITLFPGVREFLSSFSGKKVLVTRETDKGLQNRKIDTLGIRNLFDQIMICSSNEEKKEYFRRLKKQFSGQEIAVIGDRLDVDIRFAKELGMKTCRVKQGKYSMMIPSSPVEVPDVEIDHFSQLTKLLPKVFSGSAKTMGA